MKRWMLTPLLVLVLALGVPAGQAAAHPLGNFTVNQYSRLAIGQDKLRLHYIVDMAEIPAFQERQLIDSNSDGDVSPTEAQAYLASQVPTLARGLQLSSSGKLLSLQPVGQDLSFPTGQGGLLTLRLTIDFEAPLTFSDTGLVLDYSDSNYSERIGWREIVASAAQGATLREANVPSQSQSDELRSYPQDMLSSPLDVRAAHLVVAPGVTNAGALAAEPSTAPVAMPPDQFAALIANGELTPQFMAFALLLALLLGAGHALTPGHGKTIVAAYMVGARGTAKHALFLGLTTTITHTAGVFLLGFATLLLSQYILPERIFPWLELISGALVVIIGVALLWGRLKLAFGKTQASTTHDHSSGWLNHAHGPDTHTHGYDQALADWMASAEGESGRVEDTRHETQDTRPGEREATKPSVRSVASVATASPVSWRGLLALGISGGLLPCPSALVVLLSAIALNRLGFGMLLIVAFSLGMSAVLTGIGLLLVYARNLFDRFPTSGRVLRVLPVASAVLVTLAGLAISTGALLRTGVL